MSERLSIVGLFAGIGGIELGMQNSGHHAVHLNELDDCARRVLQTHFPDADFSSDVRSLQSLPKADVVTAGFPCTDISQAGRKIGIRGEQSRLIDEVFRLIQKSPPKWLVLENVSYLLRLDRGNGMRHVISALEHLDYRWAYRVVDARAFGLPQRRQRVLFVASQTEDPREILFADNYESPDFKDPIGSVDLDKGYGFYWTEGLRGLGWVHDAVPTVKSGSTIGIPSQPAIWFPDTGEVGTPQVEDGERLQGFPANWTLSGIENRGKIGVRWKQIGNAVCVPVSEWLGARLANPGTLVEGDWSHPLSGTKWPVAAFGQEGKAWVAPVGMRPLNSPFRIKEFLSLPLKPLSCRATAGFLSRARRSKLRFADGFLESLQEHLNKSQELLN